MSSDTRQIKGDYFQGQYHIDFDRSDELIKKYCPADLDNLLWKAPVSYENISKIIESAYDGFKVWRQTSWQERVDALNRYKEALIPRTESIAEAIALETGKPLWEAKTEAAALISKVDVTINESGKRITSKDYPQIAKDTDGKIVYKPIGPCFIIGPFNFPCHLANGQILSALLAGNSLIFKPSEKTLYSAQLMFDALIEANFPKGVINLLIGRGESASRMLREKEIKGLFFTGSVEVGKKILSACYKDLSKLVSLELGGKNTTIIHKDANLMHAQSELIKAAFLTAGQRCTSTSIVFIHRSIKDQFIPQFHQLAKRLIIDHPIDHKSAPFMGPLIDERAVEHYLLFMGMAKREGFEEVMRGKSLSLGYKGHYVSPSIHYFDEYNDRSHFLKNEIFGPNCTFIPYDDIDEAIEMANKTEYGLASALFTSDKDLYQRCAWNIDAGIFNFNRSTVGANSKLPFGGVKNSGNYRPAAVTTIDACVYSQSQLDFQSESENPNEILGISPE